MAGGYRDAYTEYRGSPEAFEATVAGLKNAYENGVPLTFSPPTPTITCPA